MIKQVRFVDGGGNIWGGILVMVDDLPYIICGCCGSVLELDEVEILEEYDTWANLSDEIIGN